MRLIVARARAPRAQSARCRLHQIAMPGKCSLRGVPLPHGHGGLGQATAPAWSAPSARHAPSVCGGGGWRRSARPRSRIGPASRVWGTPATTSGSSAAMLTSLCRRSSGMPQSTYRTRRFALDHALGAVPASGATTSPHGVHRVPRLSSACHSVASGLAGPHHHEDPPWLSPNCQPVRAPARLP